MGGSGDKELVDKCIEEINSLRGLVETHNELVGEHLRNINKALPTKMDKKDALNMENLVMDKEHVIL